MNKPRSKMEKCIRHIPDIRPDGNGKLSVNHICMLTDSPVTETECESCGQYKCRYIEFPVTVTEIKTDPISTKGLGHSCGELVAVRPCDPELKDKTYLGIYIGDIPHMIQCSLSDEGVLRQYAITNPCMFVPALKRLVYGYESWWHVIKSEDQLKEITDADIDAQWYVRLAKGLSDAKSPCNAEPNRDHELPATEE